MIARPSHGRIDVMVGPFVTTEAHLAFSGGCSCKAFKMESWSDDSKSNWPKLHSLVILPLIYSAARKVVTTVLSDASSRTIAWGYVYTVMWHHCHIEVETLAFLWQTGFFSATRDRLYQ